MENLLELGESLGVIRHLFGEIFDHHPSHIEPRRNDYQDWLKKLILKPGEFAEMQKRLSQQPMVHKIVLSQCTFLTLHCKRRQIVGDNYYTNGH